MYPIHVSDGIVLRKLSVGEANVIVSVLTRDMGLVRASVRSARVAASKLRFGIEPMTEGRFAFVRGRHEWRLTGVEAQPRTVLALPHPHRAALGRVAKLLLRLVPGTEPLPALYETHRAMLEALTTASSEEVESIECIAVLRTLSQLGYLPHTPEMAPFTEGDFFSAELHTLAARTRTSLVRAINASLHASGL